MRKLAVVEFVTLGGVMQSLGGPDEDRQGGFDPGGWNAPYGDEVLAQQAGQGIGQTSAYLFGRKTYGHLAAHCPHELGDNPIAASLTGAPKYVVTRGLRQQDLEGANKPRQRRRRRPGGPTQKRRVKGSSPYPSLTITIRTWRADVCR